MADHRLIACLLVLAALGCVAPGEPRSVDIPADVQPGEVAFRMAEPNDVAIIVPVTIDGRGPYDFVLDTGATLTCVGESIASELSLPDASGILGRGTTLGGSGTMRLVMIDSLGIGDTRAEDVMACAIDLSEVQAIGLDVEGLLGLNVLKEFRVTLDFERNVMRLEPLSDS